MTTEQIQEGAFKAGYEAGCPVRPGELSPSQIKANADVAYQHWSKKIKEAGADRAVELEHCNNLMSRALANLADRDLAVEVTESLAKLGFMVERP